MYRNPRLPTFHVAVHYASMSASAAPFDFLTDLNGARHWEFTRRQIRSRLRSGARLTANNGDYPAEDYRAGIGPPEHELELGCREDVAGSVEVIARFVR